ncbi:MAG: hypothetical protein MRJ96_05245 [Nitrospirales bacterium]|nr:hypothetical protein [Nitrospira sp.]MDR4500841.1 hypothetical protein [Nitrospirales bacterium]
MSVVKFSTQGGFFLCLFMWLAGCANTLDHVNLEPKTVGYQAPIPAAGTRVVVWGNHSMAVDNASMWLHQQGLVVLDRTRLQLGLNDKGVRLTGSSKDWGTVLEGAKRVGADLVAFVEVSNVKQGQKFTLSQVRSAPSFSLTVELRGVNPQTGEVLTKSKAWQTGPADDPDLVIDDLTSRALVGAWKSESSEYKVLALEDHLESPDHTSKQNVDLEGLQESSTYESNVAKGNSEPGARLDKGSSDRRAGNSSLQVPRSKAVISTNRASQHDSLTNTSIEQSPVPTSRQHVRVQVGDRSNHSPHQKEPEPAFLDQATLYEEVDSTYTDGMEPISEDEPTNESGLDSVGSQLASGALTILYTPAKLVYAGLGGIFGGLAYVLTAGHEQTAQSIWSASLQGDYFFTPAHLRGDTPLRFMGSSRTKTMAEISEDQDAYLVQSSKSKK